MAFQPPVPVKKVLDELAKHSYVLPAIQREFVWGTDKVRMLFDSLLRGYPIGSFLFWQVEADKAKDYTFYNFLTDYHEKTNPYASQFVVPAGQGVVAILDGQQRLTSLNIGVYGSHAERQARKWANNPDAYPRKRLYLNLLGEGTDEELGMQYDFRFLTEAEAAADGKEQDRWFLVHDAMYLADSGPAIMAELEHRGLGGKGPFQVLYDLYRAMREAPLINYYLEESQDSDKVLDIFVRVNSAGTTLSYSDLLLSMATNQWEDLDAREEVRSLLTALNGGSTPFAFSKDVVLKAGLMLTDTPDIRFKVSNFTKTNMSLMEKRWSDIRTALITATDLLKAFGYSERTLSADSVLIPIAYYVYARGLGSSYVSSAAAAADREMMRSWVARSLMRRGIWGSGLDTLLARLRDVIRESGTTRFPAEEMETAMASLGKSLRFDEDEIGELSELRYGRPRTFATLAMLYPGLDLTKSFHEDHIFARSRFTRPRLKDAGIDSASIPEFLEKVDCLPNLQLLAGVPNTEKQAKLPTEWLDGPQFQTPQARSHYEHENDLQSLPLELKRFLEFYEGRRRRIEERLRSLLGMSGRDELQESDDDDGDDESDADDAETAGPPRGQSWTHDEIRSWVRSDWMARAVDELETWIVATSGEIRHNRRTRHTVFSRGKRIATYSFTKKWIRLWLLGPSEEDVSWLQRVSDPSSVSFSPNGKRIGVSLHSKEDVELAKQCLLLRLQQPT